MPEPASEDGPALTIYRYTDASGQVVIVDSEDDVPAAMKPLMEKIVLEKKILEQKLEKAAGAAGKVAREQAAKKLKAEAKEVQREIGDVLPFVKELDLPSLAVGFAAAMLAFLALTLVLRTGKLVLKLALLVGALSLVSGAYMGWLRRAAGMAGGALASPQDLIDDAKKAQKQVKARLEEQERALKKIEEQTR